MVRSLSDQIEQVDSIFGFWTESCVSSRGSLIVTGGDNLYG